MLYKTKKPLCLLKKTKKRYYENLTEKSVVDNKLFWKTVKLLLYDKVAAKDKIHLVETNELVKTDLEIAEVLNNFFSKIVQNLDTWRYSHDEPLVSNTNDLTLKAILKYIYHCEIYYLLVSTNNTAKIKIRNFDVTDSKNEKLLEVKFDHKLSFMSSLFRIM